MMKMRIIRYYTSVSDHTKSNKLYSQSVGSREESRREERRRKQRSAEEKAEENWGDSRFKGVKR